jgi:hypothetical protein
MDRYNGQHSWCGSMFALLMARPLSYWISYRMGQTGQRLL